MATVSPVSSILEAHPRAAFHPTIPVVDIRDFYTNRDRFVKSVADALHNVGFFAVTNPDVDFDALQKGYDEVIRFFNLSKEEKMGLFRPDLDGQRGFVPSEKAQGNSKLDFKEFIHVGQNNNKWPEGTEFVGQALMHIFENLLKQGNVLSEALSLSIGESFDYFQKKTENADHLLRAIHYFKNPEGEPWAAAHTDIDLFTILPLATEEGLQVMHEGKWIDVRVPKNAFIINGGDMLENITNGYFKSAKHQVVSKNGETERYSIVFFVHAKLSESVAPLPKFITKEAPQAYPTATELDLLAARLVQLGIGGPFMKNHDSSSGLKEKVAELVELGVASDATKKTHACYQKACK